MVSAHQLTVPAKARQAFGKGLTLLNSQKDYPAAVTQFEAAVKACPSYYEAYAELGVAKYYAGDATAAEQALRKSIELSSGKYPYASTSSVRLRDHDGHQPAYRTHHPALHCHRQARWRRDGRCLQKPKTRVLAAMSLPNSSPRTLPRIRRPSTARREACAASALNHFQAAEGLGRKQEANRLCDLMIKVLR
jgi:tetratricopeptide (TPR) repeat protein